MRATASGRRERSQSTTPMPMTSHTIARYGVHFRMPGLGGVLLRGNERRDRERGSGDERNVE